MGHVLIKPGARLDRIAPAGYRLLDAFKAVARGPLDVDLTITSGTDGTHSGPADPHHLGEAYDVRSRGFTADLQDTILRAVLLELQRGDLDAPVDAVGGIATLHFFGFLEAAGTTNAHFHFQRRKGTLYTVEDLLKA